MSIDFNGFIRNYNSQIEVNIYLWKLYVEPANVFKRSVNAIMRNFAHMLYFESKVTSFFTVDKPIWPFISFQLGTEYVK